MNCQEVHRFLQAHADGELTGPERLAVRAHVEHCAACAQRVREQQAMRSAVRRLIDSQPVPRDLAARMQRAVDAAERGPARAGSRPMRLQRAIPLAAAACLLLAAVGMWLRGGARERGAPHLHDGPSDESYVAAMAVVTRHEECSHLGAGHQLEGLPRQLSGLRRKIAEQYAGRIATRAPDFGSSGYVFDSANFCSLDDDRTGPHLIYQHRTGGKYLSFMSVPRWDLIDRCPVQGPLADGDLRRLTATTDEGRYYIVAWHQDRTTFVCCATESIDDLARMVEPVRAAMLERRGTPEEPGSEGDPLIILAAMSGIHAR